MIIIITCIKNEELAYQHKNTHCRITRLNYDNVILEMYFQSLFKKIDPPASQLTAKHHATLPPTMLKLPLSLPNAPYFCYNA